MVVSRLRHWQSRLSFLWGTLLGVFPATGGLAQISEALIEEIVDGNQVYIEAKLANVEDSAQFGQQITTQASQAGLLFNNGASGRLGSNSSVLVGQCVEVEQGELLVSGPVNGCVAEMSVIVRGTLYLLNKTPDGNGIVSVLEGTVQVGDRRQAGTWRVVKAGERLQIRLGRLASVENIPETELINLLNGPLFTRFRRPLAGRASLQSLCQQLLPGYECPRPDRPLRQDRFRRFP
jgi:hypothetical protein